MAIDAQNLTRGARVDPAELYRVTFWTDIECPAPIVGKIDQAQRCVNTRGAHERVARNLADKQLRPDGLFALPVIARMEGDPQLLGIIGGTRMVSIVIGNPVRDWSFHELRGQVDFLGGRLIDGMRLETSATTGSALSDAANAVEDTVDAAIDKIGETVESIPSFRTVILVGGAAGGVFLAAKLGRLFS